jgi:hypothetical protein
MVEWRRLITAIVVVLIATVAVEADMMLAVCAEPEGSQVARAVEDDRESDLSTATLAFDIGQEFATGNEVAETDSQEGQAPQVLRLQDSANKLDSFDLCLYALVGLGLCRSGHLVRRPSLGFVPEWYHSGAPQQIGHSHAVGPDAFCFAAVCFLQPDSEVEPLIPQHRRGMITSLWRCSQFTPCVLASRAPPSCS